MFDIYDMVNGLLLATAAAALTSVACKTWRLRVVLMASSAAFVLGATISPHVVSEWLGMLDDGTFNPAWLTVALCIVTIVAWCVLMVWRRRYRTQPWRYMALAALVAPMVIASMYHHFLVSNLLAGTVARHYESLLQPLASGHVTIDQCRGLGYICFAGQPGQSVAEAAKGYGGPKDVIVLSERVRVYAMAGKESVQFSQTVMSDLMGSPAAYAINTEVDGRYRIVIEMNSFPEIAREIHGAFLTMLAIAQALWLAMAVGLSEFHARRQRSRK